MKHLRKISVLVLALMMVLTMGASAFAVADQDGTLEANGVVKKSDHSDVGDTLDIPKGVTVYGSLDKVYGPTVTYTYTIAPVDPAENAKVIDFNNVEKKVEKGPANSASLTDSNAEFTSTEVSLTGDKKYEVKDNITVSIATDAFTKPGVYRYVITDTTGTSALYGAGITRDDDYVKTRYLDVYVKYNSNETAFEVYGYVLNKDNLTTIEGVDDEPLKWATPEAKSSGYIASSETEALTDQYHTIDVKVTKKVTGAMGDKTHEFPFSIALENKGLRFYSGEAETEPTSVSSLTDGAATPVSGTLKNNDVFYIYGLNPKATVDYTETNDTDDVYKLTVKDNANHIVNNLDKEVIPKSGGPKNTAALKVSNYDDDNTATSVKAKIAASDNKLITFTNDLAEISPTNVVMRYAPYLFILGGAALLLVVSRRRKAEQE